MELTKEALHYLIEEVGEHAVQEVEEDGHLYVSTTPGRELRIPPPEPTAETLKVFTLRSFVAYLAANRDELDLAHCVIHVAAPDRVRLLGHLDGRHRERESTIEAVAQTLDFPFDEFQPQEAFNIALLAKFVRPAVTEEGGDLRNDFERVLKVTSRLKSGTEITAEDNGLTQSVVIRVGVENVEEVRVPNPVHLRPYRTFPEVVQPLSPFVLRLREAGGQGAAIGLWEADGGAWQLEAVRLVAEWLETAAKSQGIEEIPPILW